MAPTAKPKRIRKVHYFAQWRKKAGLTQADLESALGWSQSKTSRVEGGQTPFDQDDLERAAELFEADVVDLLKTDPDDPRNIWGLLVRLGNAPEAVKDEARSYLSYLLDGSSKAR